MSDTGRNEKALLTVLAKTPHSELAAEVNSAANSEYALLTLTLPTPKHFQQSNCNGQLLDGVFILVSLQATLVATPQGVRAAISGVSKPETTLSGVAIFTPKRLLRRDMTREHFKCEMLYKDLSASPCHQIGAGGLCSLVSDYLKC